MTPIALFWAWFQVNESSYKSVEGPDKEALMDRLQERLQRISLDLWFEVGGQPDGPSEFVISAEGKVSAFPTVLDVVRAAPRIPGWQVVAFKQPQGFDFVTEYDDIVVTPASAWFLPLQSETDPRAFGLRVGYPHFKQESEDAFVTATYIVLEAGLGELVSAMQIQYVEACLLPTMPEQAGYLRMAELPEYLGLRVTSFDS